MEELPTAKSPADASSGPGKLLLVLVPAAFALAVLFVAWRIWPRQSSPSTEPDGRETKPRTNQRQPTDPRVTYATPFRNVRPEVKYVGDQVCAGCHASHAETFRQHPMGRSLSPVAEVASQERYEPVARNPFQALGLHYHVEPRDGRVFHRETAKGPQDKILSDHEQEVHFAVGSGTRGRSYLINHQGYLFMSPITWYPQKGLWDLSPGYTVRNQHFGRPVTAECLFCHCDHAQKVDHTFNRYREPIFRGHAISCERCHGPGELHVRRHKLGEEPAAGRTPKEDAPDIDYSIVNPRHLEPALREAVCQQCHLQGQQRVLRWGRDSFDYRPGLPLHLFIAVFVKPPEAGKDSKFVGQFEQMHASRCFQKSKGQLGCISCHDPHRVPAATEKVAYYRARCLTCHQEKSCSLPLKSRLEQSKDDSCIQCHMARMKADITHTSISDHRIPRRPEKAGADLTAEQMHEAEKRLDVELLAAGKPPMVCFHRDLLDPFDQEASRDLGVALVERGEKRPPPVQVELAKRALPLLEAWLETNPADLPALEARAIALWGLGHPEESVLIFDGILARVPDRENTLSQAASLAMEMHRHEAAVSYWRRAIKVNPWRWEYHHALAVAHVRRSEWNQGLHACQQALELNPAGLEVRKLLLGCYLGTGDKAKAAAEFERLMDFNPPDREELRRRFLEQLR